MWDLGENISVPSVTLASYLTPRCQPQEVAAKPGHAARSPVPVRPRLLSRPDPQGPRRTGERRALNPASRRWGGSLTAGGAEEGQRPDPAAT